MKKPIFLGTKYVFIRPFLKPTVILLAFLLFVSPLSPVFAQEEIDSTNVKSDTEIKVVPSQEVLENPISLPVLLDVKKDSSKAEKTELDKELETKNKKETELTKTPPDNEAPSPLSNKKQLLPQIDELTGALTYRYDIVIPKGRNNLTPDISLRYNSALENNDSIVGHGWELGIPSIQRVNRKGVNKIYSEDTFSSSLSGELTAIATSTFVAKVDTGSFIIYEKRSSGWIVTDKQGTKYIFGANSQARQDDPDDSSKIYKWMLEEVGDTNNNFVKYNYFKSGGQIFPDSIIYAGNGTTVGIYEIDFDRTGSTSTVESNYAAFKINSPFLINKIVTKINGTEVHSYSLTYENGHNGRRQLLSSIVESGKDDLGVTTTLPATTFEYHVAGDEPVFDAGHYQLPFFNLTSGDGGHQFLKLDTNTQLVDVNGDGMLDFVHTADNITYSSNTINDNNDDKPRVYLNTGNGWIFDPAKYQIPTYNFTGEVGGYRFLKLIPGTQLIDVNGDGLPDFVSSNDEHFRNPNNIISNNNDLGPRVYLNTGNGWSFDSSHYQIPYFHLTDAEGGYHFIRLDSINQLVDVNGDGLPDFVSTEDEHFRNPNNTISNNNDIRPRVYLNNGNGWSFDPSHYQLPFYNMTDSNGGYHFIRMDFANQLIDVNGDSLPDFVSTDDEHSRNPNNTVANNNDVRPRVYLNNGNGWAFDPSHFQIPYFKLTDLEGGYQFIKLDANTEIIDVNGDGLGDFVDTEGDHFRSQNNTAVDNNNAKPRVYLNTGNGWSFDPSYYQLPFFNITNTDGGYHFIKITSAIKIIDVNGDGLVDFVDTESEHFRSTSNIVSDNNDSKPRVYFNTGNGWAFDPNKYQIPSYRLTDTEGGYQFLQINPHVQLVDANGDGTLDFVNTSDSIPYVSSTIIDNNNDKPRSYLNTKDKSDFLKTIATSIGASMKISYKQKIILDRNPYSLPQTLYVVKDIVTNDSLGNVATSTMDYDTGKYFFHPEQFKTFAGFADVVRTDATGNVVKNYYYQGNGTSTLLGEYSDHVSKIGIPYRTEEYDNAGHLYRLTLNKWDRYNLGINHDFAKLLQKTVLTYDGDGDHRDTTTEYTYDNTNGNLLTQTDWGEVTASSTNSSFSDVGSDKLVKNISYATNVTNSIVTGFPSREIVTDQSGATVSDKKYYYDGLAFGSVNKGNLTKQEQMKSASYISTEKTYNSYGLVTQEKDSRDKTTTYSYDTFNLYPTTATNALNQTSSFVYDYSIGKPKQTTDPNGHTFAVIYDGLDRVVAEKQPDSASPSTLVTKTEYSYADDTFPTSVTKTDYLSASASVPSYVYFDGLGRVIQERRHSEGTGSGGNTNDYSVKDTAYNLLGQKARETLPYFSTGSSRTIAPSAGASGNGTGSGASPLWNNFTYDAVGRIKTITNVIGITTNTYDDWKLTVTDAKGNTKDLYKDARGNLVQVDEHNNGDTYTTTYQWNALGNLTKITDANGNIRNFTYDKLGRRLTAEDLHGHGDTTYSVWTYTYDDAGNLATLVDGKGQTVNYSYDDLNRELTEDFTGATGIEASYTYDSCANGVGKLCLVTFVSGADTWSSSAISTIVSSYVYDALGRATSETKNISARGAGAGTGTDYQTSYQYDRAGNPTLITNPDGAQIKYEYNAGGAVEKISRKGAIGDSDASTWTQVVSDLNYSPEGKVTEQINHNGTHTTNTFDASALYRLANKKTESATGGEVGDGGGTGGGSGGTGTLVLQDIDYTYDSIGNIIKLSDTSQIGTKKTVFYTYDNLSRLLTASSTAMANGQQAYKQTYSYDAIGNIMSKTGVKSYSYPSASSANQYGNPHAVIKTMYVSSGNPDPNTDAEEEETETDALVGGGNQRQKRSMSAPVDGDEDTIIKASYIYDKNGNMLVSGSAHSSWDYRNTLTKLITNQGTNGTTATFAYDHTGNRVKYSNGTNTTIYPNKYFNIILSTATTTTSHIFLGDEMVATVQKVRTGVLGAPVIQYTHTDHLSGANVSTDGSGVVSELTDFYPYGSQRLEQSFNGNAREQRKFTGHEYDEDTGLNYMGARYQNPKLGRFTSLDPIFLGLGTNQKQDAQLLVDPQSLNSYAYARNNPLKYVDQNGEFPVVAALLIYAPAITAFVAMNAPQIISYGQSLLSPMGQWALNQGLDDARNGHPVMAAFGILTAGDSSTATKYEPVFDGLWTVGKMGTRAANAEEHTFVSGLNKVGHAVEFSLKSTRSYVEETRGFVTDAINKGFPTKLEAGRDVDILRVYNKGSNTFSAFEVNKATNGITPATMFKPSGDGMNYFNNSKVNPGSLINIGHYFGINK